MYVDYDAYLLYSLWWLFKGSGNTKVTNYR